MFVPPEVLESVGFIYATLKGEKVSEPVGTVFFLKVLDQTNPSPPWPSWHYAITARHVLDDIADYSTHKNTVFFRMNKHDGFAGEYQMARINWYSHPTDTSVDVAVLPWEPPHSEFKFQEFTLGGFHSAEIKPIITAANPKGVGWRFDASPGRDVFISGLFVERPGVKRNIPVVRTGTIAALEGEPIDTRKPFDKVVAHLIETRSTGGLSGAPVFSIPELIRGRGVIATEEVGQFSLLGLIHGHWDDPSFIAPKVYRQINMGMAMVVPTKKILEVLRQPRLVEQRRKELGDSMGKKNIPKLDSNLLARAVVEAAIGEPLTSKKKAKKTVKKGSKRVS